MIKGSPISRNDALPTSLAPLGASLTVAAALVAVPSAVFEKMVFDGRMPKPKNIDGLSVWSVREVTIAFEALPNEGERNEWDDEPQAAANRDSSS